MTTRTRKLLFAATLAEAAFLPLFPALGLSIEPMSLLPLGTALLVLGGMLVVYRRLERAPRIQLTLESTLWGAVLSNLFYLPMYVIVHLPRPLADDALLKADRALGVDVASLVGFVGRHPALGRMLGSTYDSLTLVCVLALVMPPILGQARWTSELLLGLVLAIVQSLLLLAFVQGVGPWVHAGFSPSELQVSCGDVMKLLKSGAPYRIDLRFPDPLIAFPSWHVILALIAGFALARQRFVRVFAVLWALATVVSTLTTGWHYLIDVLGGIAVAAVSVWGAHRLASSEWLGLASGESEAH